MKTVVSSILGCYIVFTNCNTMAIWTGPDEISVGENYSYLDGEIKNIDFSFYE